VGCVVACGNNLRGLFENPPKFFDPSAMNQKFFQKEGFSHPNLKFHLFSPFLMIFFPNYFDPKDTEKKFK